MAGGSDHLWVREGPSLFSFKTSACFQNYFAMEDDEHEPDASLLVQILALNHSLEAAKKKGTST